MLKAKASGWNRNEALKPAAIAVLAFVLVAWVAYLLLGSQIITAVYHSSGTVQTMLLPGKSTTPVEDYLQATDRLMAELTMQALALAAVLMLLRKSVRTLLCVGGLGVMVLVLLFTILEIFPSLAFTLHLDEVSYYDQQKYLIPDSILMYRQRPYLNAAVVETLDPREFGVAAPKVANHWKTDEEGFSTAGAYRNADVVVLGDSMLTSGVDFDDTFGNRLEEHLSGWSVSNLATGGQGPFQYKEILGRYGLKKKPRYAIFGFNEGNDLHNIAVYEDWVAGNRRSIYARGVTSPIARFTIALRETASYIRRQAQDTLVRTAIELMGHEHTSGYNHPDLARVHLPKGESVPFLFIDEQNPHSVEELEQTHEWAMLRQVLVEFQHLCDRHDIVPVVLFIPTASHIYAEYSGPDSGSLWLAKRDEQVGARDNMENALARLSEDLGISFVTLTQPFSSAAHEGRQVYESFSVHMTSEGTEVAAGYVAEKVIELANSGEDHKRVREIVRGH